MHVRDQRASPGRVAPRTWHRGRILQHPDLEYVSPASMSLLVGMPTSPVLYNLLQLLLSLHCTQVESFHNWSCCSKLWGVIWRRRKLLDHLTAHTSGGLFPPYDRTVSEIALDEEDHFFVAYQDVIATHNVQPPL